MKKFALLLSIAMLVLSGCQDDQKEQKAVKEPKKEEKSEAPKPVQPVTYPSPLTGVPTTVQSKERAIAVMINNHRKARPQSGLAQADVVYEVLAEGDTTRFVAIFQSEKPNRIGPVRSARDYYINIAKGYGALYICHGNSPEAKQMLANGVVDSLNGIVYDGVLFKRSTDRYAPHNSYITYDNIVRGAKMKNYALTGAPAGLSFMKREELVSGEAVLNVTIPYFLHASSHVMYKYDVTAKKYIRYSAGEVTIDAETKKPIQLDNVFIVETKHVIQDNVGRRDVDLTSGGKAYLLQQGKLRKVDWRNVNGRILPYENGELVRFVQGKTWVNLVPQQPGLAGLKITTVKEK